MGHNVHIKYPYYLIGKDGKVIFYVALGCLVVSNITKKKRRIAIKFYGGVRGGKRKNCLNFGSNLSF